MTLLTFLNQRLPALLAIGCCLFASALALLEPNEPAVLPTHASAAFPDEPTDVDGQNSQTPPPIEAGVPAIPNAEVIGLRVWPKSISLTNASDRQSLVAQLVYSNGITVDVSDRVQGEPAKPLVKFHNGNWLPLADGATQLNLSVAGHKQTVPVTVSGCKTKPPISFTNDVMPVFSKTGCNAGSCHGASRGKDGFRLSLYGFDPAGDLYRLTREQPGRRIDLAVPEDCLLINKATGAVPHSGGQLFDRNSENYQTLLQWISDGAKIDQTPPPKVTSIQLFPESAMLCGPAAKQKLTVLAHYEDGSDRDVTSLAYFSTNQDNILAVEQSGQVESGASGEAFVMCRFDTHTVGRWFTALPAKDNFKWRPVKPANYIDTTVHNKLRSLRIQPSERCTDAEFVRRCYLDICGLLPTPQELEQFTNDPSPDKRSRCIDQLLERDEFNEMWVMKWSELLQIRSNKFVSYKATLFYYEWLQNRIAANTPIDQWVQELLTAKGATMSSPPANFFHAEPDVGKLTENVAQAFLGMRIQCAQCHNHPFDRWTMDDYYGFKAFFSQIGRKAGSDPREAVIFTRGGGQAKHPVTQKDVPPKFLGGEAPTIEKGQDRREILGKWITSSKNPYFSRNLANIVWAHFHGRGIVDQVDDVRVSNPPVNEALLQQLADKLIESNYDFKELVRDICNSRTYQLSTRTNESNEGDSVNFSHAKLRRIRAEVLLDAISQVTETKNKFRGLPLGARAVQIADGNTSNYFLKTFGRASRETVCSCEVKMEPNLSQALHLLNGATVHKKIIQGKVIRTLVKAKMTNAQIIDSLYLRCLGRKANEAEQTGLAERIKAEPDRVKALEDVFWAILNSSEFVFNH